MRVKITREDALIIVDVQNDFMPTGALPVPDGDKVVPVLNEYIEIFKKAGSLIVATRDWHPENHCSFKPYGGQWPVHCVQGTEGAEFHKDLKLPEDTIIISKATSSDKDAYSGFQDTELYKILKEKGIKRLFIGGLATDFCVKATVLDGLKLGFCVFFLKDGSRAVFDEEKAISEMLLKGAVEMVKEEIWR